MVASLLAVLIVFFVPVAFVLSIEWLSPSTRRIARTVGFNLTYGFFMAAFSWLIQPLAHAEGEWATRSLHLTQISLPEHGWGIVLSATVLMLAEDLTFYWVHRAQHRFEFLWAMHSFHHSDDDLNATSAVRHYWFEKPVWMLLLYLPLGIFFRISSSTAVLYGFFFQFFALFPHMNVRLELGPLSRVILGPQVHRIHHSIYREHFNTNFCGAFPIWDLLFGTYRAPAPNEFPPTGVPSMPGRPSAVRVLLWPFWKSEESTASSAAAAIEQSGPMAT